MNMLRKLADQVPFLIIASVLPGMPMFFQLTIQLFRHCIAAVVMMMAFALLLAAGQDIFIATIIVLMLLYTAGGCFFHGNSGQNHGVSCKENDSG
jgi:hypothetical protein